jgi:hypothetical protein
MMNKYDEIKSLLKASRQALDKNLNESQSKEILMKYNLVLEQEVEKELDKKYQNDKKEISLAKDSDDIGKQRDKQKAYKIQGNILVLHGKDDSELELTTDEKNAFIESIDEFRNQVAELVEFGKMNIFPENVEWSGKVLELNLEFFYTINEPHGIYLNGDMIKLDQEYLEMVGKLQQNYEKFKTKWSKIVAIRQQI